jgi:hypothetical protein
LRSKLAHSLRKGPLPIPQRPQINGSHVASMLLFVVLDWLTKEHEMRGKLSGPGKMTLGGTASGAAMSALCCLSACSSPAVTAPDAEQIEETRQASTRGGGGTLAGTPCWFWTPGRGWSYYLANLSSDANNCGACGNVCPGTQTSNDNLCTNGACSFSCQGENYDVDGDPANGCEVTAWPQGNHSKDATLSGGWVSICNGTFNFSGQMPSDARLHWNPSVAGFDTASGTAPAWYSVGAQGSPFCQDDLFATLQLQGSMFPSCYKLTAITDKNTYLCQTDATGSCTLNYLSAFDDNTTIYFEVQKTCSTASNDDASYTLSGTL